MKKIMCALVAVAMAAVANAAAMSWSTSTAMYCGNSTDTFNGTLYLIDAANISQADLVTALSGGADISTYAVASATATAGKITATVLDPVKKADGTAYAGGGQVVDFYSAAIVDGKLFASASKSVTLADVGEAKASFSLKSASQNADNFKPVGGDPIPEPTSGLLLLLGGAMLALRRKQK